MRKQRRCWRLRRKLAPTCGDGLMIRRKTGEGPRDSPRAEYGKERVHGLTGAPSWPSPPPPPPPPPLPHPPHPVQHYAGRIYPSLANAHRIRPSDACQPNCAHAHACGLHGFHPTILISLPTQSIRDRPQRKKTLRIRALLDFFSPSLRG